MTRRAARIAAILALCGVGLYEVWCVMLSGWLVW